MPSSSTGWRPRPGAGPIAHRRVARSTARCRGGRRATFDAASDELPYRTPQQARAALSPRATRSSSRASNHATSLVTTQPQPLLLARRCLRPTGRADGSLAWIGAVSASLLSCHGCRSGTGSDRAPADARSSSRLAGGQRRRCFPARGAVFPRPRRSSTLAVAARRIRPRRRRAGLRCPRRTGGLRVRRRSSGRRQGARRRSGIRGWRARR